MMVEIYLFSDEDFQILKPKSSDTFLKYIRPFIGAREYISNKKDGVYG